MNASSYEVSNSSYFKDCSTLQRENAGTSFVPACHKSVRSLAVRYIGAYISWIALNECAAGSFVAIKVVNVA
jgi:hypothetical protein